MPRGGSHIDMVYIYVPAFWGTFSRNLVQRSGGFSSETKEPKLHKLGVFWAHYCKKHPIWSKLGAFLSKMVYWWVGNLAKSWYRDSQIFEVRQAHPRTILVEEPPPPGWMHSSPFPQKLQGTLISLSTCFGHSNRVFFSKFLMGGDSKFLVPVGPRQGRSRMGGGACKKNPTEAKTAHLMQN